MDFSANCTCGNISVKLNLPNSIEKYQLRKCDCDFCLSHDIVYLSDQLGVLDIFPNNQLRTMRQGSEQAEFKQCLNCGQVIAATSRIENEMRGAVNAQLLVMKYSLSDPITVSPKLLSADEKRRRWSEMWLKVILNDA